METGQATQRSCDIILHVLVKLGTRVAVGCLLGEGRVGKVYKGLEGEGGVYYSVQLHFIGPILTLLPPALCTHSPQSLILVSAL